MRLSIRYRLLVPLGLLLFGVIGASLWSAHVAARRAEERIAAQLTNVAQTLNAAPFPLTAWVLEQMKGLSGAEFLLLNPDGSRLTTFAAEPVHLPAEAELQDLHQRDLGPPVRVDNATFRCRRLVLREHPNDGRVVFIYYPETLLDEAIADAQRPSLLGLLFGLVAVALTLGISQRLVGRIRQLEKRTRQIAGGDFSPMTLPRADDEMRDLTSSVNEMAERLDRLHRAVERTERARLTAQLAGGLAHQLRNGVTGAKLAVQVYLADHPNGNSEALSVTLRQLALMETNLRRFIDLERPSEGKKTSVSLPAILTEVVDMHRPRCDHVGIELRWVHSGPDVMLDGDASQLTDLFINLVGNAVDAVGTKGIVEVILLACENKINVQVIDSGPGPTADIAARLFEPFVTGKPEGIGLGLAVARQAAQAHGGVVSWRRIDDRTVFSVLFAKNRNSES